MKMIRAVIRPEKEQDVVDKLAQAGIPGLTKIDVLGRGRQKGIQVGSTVYDELAKTMFMVVVPDDKLSVAIGAIQEGAHTGNFGDGKIFVTPVDQVTTIRTGVKES